MMKSLVIPAKTASILIPKFVFNHSKSQSSVSNSVSFRNLNFVRRVRPIRSSSSSFSYSSSHDEENRHCYPTDGEIHVIVGPMFAGKTTTLLHRIKSESSNGRFHSRVPNGFVNMDETLKNMFFWRTGGSNVIIKPYGTTCGLTDLFSYFARVHIQNRLPAWQKNSFTNGHGWFCSQRVSEDKAFNIICKIRRSYGPYSFQRIAHTRHDFMECHDCRVCVKGS